MPRISKLLNILISTSLVSLFCFYSQAVAEQDHTLLIKSYEGSETCLDCHYTETVDLTESLHYKLKGEAQFVYDMFTNKPVQGQYGKGNRY